MKSVIKRILNSDWASLQEDVEKIVAEKLKSRVSEKKIEVLSKINGITTDKMKEIISVSNQ
jgi:hypothetical protein